jgi:hypothetical protein
VKITKHGTSNSIWRRSRRINRQVYIPFYIGNDCFEHVFLVSDRLTELLLIGADFVLEYGFIVNFTTNCLIYDTDGNIKECKFTNNTERELESQKQLMMT